jgi:predicted GNAT superfamily acetyltransferase
VELELDKELILVQIPTDYYLMLNLTDVEETEVRQIPVNWRLQTRKVFLDYFNKGYRVVDFLRDRGKNPRCFYLLKRLA